MKPQAFAALMLIPNRLDPSYPKGLRNESDAAFRIQGLVWPKPLEPSQLIILKTEGRRQGKRRQHVHRLLFAFGEALEGTLMRLEGFGLGQKCPELAHPPIFSAFRFHFSFYEPTASCLEQEGGPLNASSALHAPKPLPWLTATSRLATANLGRLGGGVGVGFFFRV